MKESPHISSEEEEAAAVRPDELDRGHGCEQEYEHENDHEQQRGSEQQAAKMRSGDKTN